MGFALILIGLLLWLLFGWFVVGLILIILGIILVFVPGVPYGYHSRRGPP